MRPNLLHIALVLLLWGIAAPVASQTVSDASLVVETVVTQTDFGGPVQPTTMAFVAPDDILVLQKTNGQVRRVLSGVLQGGSVLDVNVNAENERGLLGIAVDPLDSTDVFLYYTEAAVDTGTALGNRVYRYVWNAGAGTLSSPTLLLDLPVVPGFNHNGGVLVADGTYLYVVIGDLNRDAQLENYPAGAAPDDSAVILRVLHDGSPAPGNPFTPYCSTTTTTTCTSNANCPGGESCITKVARYYAYGVRNSFGMALDPIYNRLWNTENGPNSNDEVNRVSPGFNSGWEQIMGPDALDPQGTGDLFNMPGAGSTYSDPEFTWFPTPAPTAIVFPAGSSLGPSYDHVALVAVSDDPTGGQIYRFPLNGLRTAFDFSAFPDLQDLLANNDSEDDQLEWGQGFGSITDLKVGPDGALYVVSIFPAAIYRIRPISPPVDVPSHVAFLVLGAVLLAALAAALPQRRRSA